MIQIADASLSGRRSVQVAIAGSGGAGVMTAGNLVLDAAAKAGWYGLMVRSSGPQIRGGEAAALLRIADHPVDGLDDTFDVLLAIDWENVHRFADEIPLSAASLIVGDPGQGEAPEVYRRTAATVAAVPFKQTAKAIPGSGPNMVALGVIAGLLGLPADVVREVARAALKKPEARDASIAAIDAGLAAAAGLGPAFPLASPERTAAPRWLLSGNEATGFGALRGGVHFVAAYPITPATEILEWMAPALKRVGGTLVQAEDELASINMILGASYGGVPSLTATAGPGLSLMTEALGLGVAAEIPIVVVDVMRGGPSTGIPAKSEQGDLGLALWGLHGDAPRVVVAPNSVADCLHASQWAVHLAESLQSVAIVLSDQFLGQTRAVVDRPADIGVSGGRVLAAPGTAGYKRYAVTESGVSPMAIPGMAGVAYTADGLEHTERGIPTIQAGEHPAQLDKHARKHAAHDYGARWADIEGEGDVAVITFGSCTAAAREAVARARDDGVAARLVSIRLLAPARPKLLAAALDGVTHALVVEQNHGGQLHRYLRAEYDLDVELVSLRRPGPLPLRPDEIHRQLLQWRQA